MKIYFQKRIQYDYLSTLISVIITISILNLFFILPACRTKIKDDIKSLPIINAIDSSEQKLFNLKLNKSAISLLKEVETHYGKKIKEELVYNWDASKGAESEVISDGTPVIRLNDKIVRSEINIVHELFHLKLNAQGSPEVNWHSLKGANKKIDQKLTLDLQELLYDPILHHIFYPEMRALGYDPDSSERESIKNIIQITSLNKNVDRLMVILTYFQANLEINELALLKNLEEWYKINNFKEELNLGNAMIKMVRTSKISSVEQQINAYVNCLNLLFKDIAQFEVDNWGIKKLGNISRRTVTILIKPPISKSE